MRWDKVIVQLGDQQVELQIQTLEGLHFLASTIGELMIPEKKKVHAEKMSICKEGEYWLAFYEAAIHMFYLINFKDYDLEEAVMTVADVIPTAADIPYCLKWGDDFSVSKQQLIEYANKIRNKKDMKGPDANVARRILRKKATGDEWKHFALRFADVDARIRSDHSNFWDFFQCESRAIMEIAELKKNIKKVEICDDMYEMPRPFHPPWYDIGLWNDTKYKGKGIV